MIRKGESFFKKNNNTRVNCELKRVDFLSHRLYHVEGTDKYYPSVTTILGAAPVNPYFLEWLKDTGANSEIIRDKAATEGTAVHEAIEQLCKGEKLEWVDEYGKAKYPLIVWQMILRFADFYNTYKPKSLGSELFLWSEEYEYAGATDYLCEIDGKTWLIDFKTSNQLSKNYDLQLAAYAKALEERRGIKVDKCGVLWLKAATKKHSKTPGVYQGEGWQIKETEDIEKDFKAFLNVYEIYKIYNPGAAEPIYKSYPTEIQLT